LSEAQQLVVDRNAEFECWGKPQSHEVAALIVSTELSVHILVRDCSGGHVHAEGRLPVSESGENSLQQTAGSILKSVALTPRSEFFWFASYDRIETSSGRVIRRHLFAVEVDSFQQVEVAPAGFRWVESAKLESYTDRSARRGWEYFSRCGHHRHLASPFQPLIRPDE
jgi:hypothetical protein